MIAKLPVQLEDLIWRYHIFKMLILSTATAFYEIESDWSLTELVTSLTTGDVWDIANFGSYALAANGNAMVERNTTTGNWAALTSSADIPRVLTLCNFKGQCIGGNVKTTWHGCSTNSLVWSEIGSIKFAPTKLNTAGFRNISWPGDILRVKRLGDTVIVYGEEGIGVLVPVNEPAPTFGFKNVMNVGIPAKGAVGGDEHVHVFVDEEGYLWIMTEGQAPKRLGYQEFFSALTAASIVVAHDPSEQEFYISDGSTSYLLTPYGLCETYQRVTSAVRISNTTHGPFSSGSDTSFTITTDTLDFGIRGFKTLATVELGVDTGGVSQAVQVGTQQRANKTGAFSSLSYINTSPNGVAMPIRTAEEFRVSVKAAAYGGMNLDYINLRVKLVDRRSIRGLYAMQKYAEAERRG